MQITSTEADVTLRVDIALERESESVKYRDGYSNFRAWKVQVIFEGSTVADALADGAPRVSVIEGYRIKLDGFRGARASRFHTLGWHNCEKADFDRIVHEARYALITADAEEHKFGRA